MIRESRGADLSELETILGHTFNDRERLTRAITHGSHAASDGGNTYQRLEFLGDRVLALVVADALTERYPNAEEGELARRLNALVRAETCAEIAREIGIADHVRTDDLDVTQNSRAARAVLADVCEAVIAAIYRDGGLEPARAFILRHWNERIDLDDGARRDPKTALQEWAHARKEPTPEYEEVSRDGPDHAPVFTVSVRVGAMEQIEATGRSKREAQQAAAQKMLEREGVWQGETR